jgi:hypothetical protein
VLFVSVERTIVDRTEKVNAIAEILSEGTAGSHATLRIRGGCMAPALPDGTRVAARRARLVLPGDVVVFRGSNDLTAHRVLGYWVRGFRLALVTRGDNCDRHDGLIELDRVVGRLETPVSTSARLRAAGSFIRLLVAKAGRRA